MTTLTDRFRRAHRSEGLDWIARGGLLAYGVVYVLVGWLALQLAFGDRQGHPSSTGALRELAQQPFGDVLLWTVSAGLVLLVLWQLATAVAGHQDEDGAGRIGRRLLAGLKAVVYAGIAFTGMKIAVGAGASSGKKDETTLTAQILDLPAGQVLVGLVGAVVVVIGVVMVVRAWTKDFGDELTHEGRRGTSGTAYVGFGRVGQAARGVAFTAVGGLIVYAAVSHSARKTGGLDQALFEVLDQPFGPVLVGLVGAGLICFGIFAFVRARLLSRD